MGNTTDPEQLALVTHAHASIAPSRLDHCHVALGMRVHAAAPAADFAGCCWLCSPVHCWGGWQMVLPHMVLPAQHSRKS
jgi:hypothetical protein